MQANQKQLAASQRQDWAEKYRVDKKTWTFRKADSSIDLDGKVDQQLPQSSVTGKEYLDEINKRTESAGQYPLQPTKPGSPAEQKFGPSVRAPGPPGANVCPGCGGLFTKEKCSCGFLFSWDNSPEQWRSMLKVCPTCKSSLQFTNGSVQCTVCPFLMVIDSKSFDRKSMRDPRSMYIPKLHPWQQKEADQFNSQPR